MEEDVLNHKVQMEVKKAQKQRSIRGMIYKSSQDKNGIKETRIKHGLTIKQVSDLTSVPYRSLQNWEAGVRKCPDYVTNMVVTMIEQNTMTHCPHCGMELK